MDLPIEHIAVVDGIARTKNRSVKVRMIAAKHIDGEMTPGEVAEHYGISLADVYAAMAYYYDHQEEFDTLDRENQAYLDEHAVNSQELLAKMRSRCDQSSRE